MDNLKQPDIYIVGLGIVHVDQITTEANRVMAASNTILFVERGHGIRAHLSRLSRNLIDLTELYAEDGDRQETYRAMASVTIEWALKNPPVTLALYGHPLIFSYPPVLVREMARHLNLTVKTLPGISAMDCIFVDLNIDPATNGMQIFEATDLLLRRRPLFTDVPALIWQVGALETGLFSTRLSTGARFTRFKAHLTKFYPEDHEVFAVHSTTHPLLNPEIFKFELCDIESYSPLLHAGFSLYVPPLKVRATVDLELAAATSDPSYLKTITTAGLS